MGCSINVSIDVNTPGVKTVVTQTIDLSRLEPHEWTRVHNAAKSGLVTGDRSYASKLLTDLAKCIDVVPPLIIGTNGGWRGPSVTHPWVWEAPDADVWGAFDDLIKVSAVREKLNRTAAEAKGHRPHPAESRRVAPSRWYRAYMTLPGFRSTTEIRKSLAKTVCKHPQMVAAREALTAFIETKPVITIETTEF